jgi:protein phosphatase PTC7
VRGAGTPSPAAFKVYGENGESDEFVFGDEEEGCGFDRGARQKYTVFSKELGNLEKLHIRQLPVSSSETGHGWFLDRVVIRGPFNGVWNFPCGAWLGRNDADGTTGSIERELTPVNQSQGVVSSGSLGEPFYAPLDVPLSITIAAIAIPHPEKVADGAKGVNKKGFGHAGEDAYFFASNTETGIVALGVADGVYMWKTKGIDAGEYSRGLMSASREAALNVDPQGQTDLLQIMKHAAIKLEEQRVDGSSTCCLVMIDSNKGRLAAANLGDSGYMILTKDKTNHRSDRSMRIKFRTPQQEHSFGHPYQLGSHPTADKATDCMLSTASIYQGDVVILGSDGLFDNVSDAEICEKVGYLLGIGASPNQIAQKLAFMAFEHSVDKKRQTPFSVSATEAFDMVYNGGKADDITVLCALVA